MGQLNHQTTNQTIKYRLIKETLMIESGSVEVNVQDGIGTITFFHPKKNSLPSILLKNLAEEVDKMAANEEARVVVLQSKGEGTFCAGASFDELLSIDNFEQGKDFFMGFARLILAMKRCSKFVITRVHGKAVGGGVGVVAASDYALAVEGASLKLSELAVGIGPFVVGPAVEKKTGTAGFAAMSIDTEWRDTKWGEKYGLYAQIFDSLEGLDKGVKTLAKKLAGSNPEAMSTLKRLFWEGTEDWDKLLPARAEISGKLVLSDFTVNAISAFKKR